MQRKVQAVNSENLWQKRRVWSALWHLSFCFWLQLFEAILEWRNAANENKIKFYEILSYKVELIIFSQLSLGLH